MKYHVFEDWYDMLMGWLASLAWSLCVALLALIQRLRIINAMTIYVVGQGLTFSSSKDPILSLRTNHSHWRMRQEDAHRMAWLVRRIRHLEHKVVPKTLLRPSGLRIYGIGL